MTADLNQLKETLGRARAEVAKVIIGQGDAIDKCLIVIFTNQHGLLEGVPGVAKTLLVRTLARVLGCDFGRVQFTPDLMPADITGTNVYNLKENRFVLVKGPVFTTFLLADEINRAPAKTQSALLQAMQERRVSIDNETHRLPDNFTVFATQNPIEYEGTYPLPEAQKDRFMMKIAIPLPEERDELALARAMLTPTPPESLLDTVQPALDEATLADARAALGTILVKEDLVGYLLQLVRRTRTHEAILVGAGPRGTQALLLAARAAAAVDGRDFVTPDDIKDLAIPVLAHRLMLRPEFELEGLTVAEVLQRILEQVPVPR